MRILRDVSLKNYSTFKVGDGTKYFARIENEEELIEAINFSQDKDVPFFILGRGSNVLFPDEEYPGLIIKVENRQIFFKKNQEEEGDQKQTVSCGAGVDLQHLVNFVADHNLSGLEWAVGIPASVGGVICGNAGAFGREMKDIVKKVKALDLSPVFKKNDQEETSFNKDSINAKIKEDNLIKEFSTKECEFSYRNSLFKEERKYIILEAEIELKKDDKQEIKRKMKENLNYKNTRQPLNYPSLGSIFKNPALEEFSEEEQQRQELAQISREGRVPAAYLIDKCGLKGEKKGGAQISEKQPNFIINIGNAKAKEVKQLISLIKTKVKKQFGVELKKEIIILNKK